MEIFFGNKHKMVKILFFIKIEMKMLKDVGTNCGKSFAVDSNNKDWISNPRQFNKKNILKKSPFVKVLDELIRFVTFFFKEKLKKKNIILEAESLNVPFF